MSLLATVPPFDPILVSQKPTNSMSALSLSGWPAHPVCTEAETLLSYLRGVEKSSLAFHDTLHLIAVLTEALATAKAIRNAHSAVNCLPVELLIMIFKWVPREELHLEWFDSPAMSTKELIPITHVCRLWRHVALSVHSLWSTINDTPVTQNAIFLERSGCSLLTCRMFMTSQTVDFSMNILERNSQRIRKLQAIPCNDTRSPVFPALLRLPMPQLEQASIGHYDVAQFSPPGQFLLFDNHAPRLRKLVLFRTRGFPENQFHSLTHLSFTAEWYSTVKLPELVAFLSRCPYLRHILVAGLHFNPATRQIEHTANLRHLRTLAIRSTRSLLDINSIISSIIMPPSAALFISGAYYEDFTAVRVITPPASTKSRPYTRVHFNLYNNRFSMVAAGQDATIGLDAIPSPTHDCIAKLKNLPPWFQAETITELWMRIESSPRSAPVLALTHLFPSARSLVLRVDKYGINNAYDALVRDDAWDALHLPVLHIGPCVTSVRLCLWYGSIPPPVGGGLARRAQVGPRLERLVIEIPQDRVPTFNVAELEMYADSLEIWRTTRCEWMEVPETYGKQPHHKWPEWPERTRWAPLPDVPWATDYMQAALNGMLSS